MALNITYLGDSLSIKTHDNAAHRLIAMLDIEVNLSHSINDYAFGERLGPK